MEFASLNLLQFYCFTSSATRLSMDAGCGQIRLLLKADFRP